MTDTKLPLTNAPRRGAGIREVARRAGVSIATVSRALSGGEAVSPATRERIVTLAQALDYQPSPLGRNLVRGRSSLIGLIVPNVSFPLYGEMIRGIEDVLSGQGMSALLASSHDDTHTELASAQRILDHAVDGGIVINSLLGADLPEQRGLKWVQVSPETPHLPCRVELDNEAGGRLAARELLRLSRRELAYIAAPGRESLERERGFAFELQVAGLSYHRIEGDYSEASGGRAGESLPKHIDGVFAAGDLMAAGLLRTLHAREVRVPQEVAVIGFDDAAIAALLSPRLSSIRQPGYQMGISAAEMSLNLIQGLPGEALTFAPELIRRESTGPP